MQEKRLKDYENSSLGTGSNSRYNPLNIKPLKRQYKLLLRDFFGRLSADSLYGSLMLLDHSYFTGSGRHPCKVHLEGLFGQYIYIYILLASQYGAA